MTLYLKFNFMSWKKLQALFFVIPFLLVNACSTDPKTEVNKTFLKFSQWAKAGHSVNIKKYAEKKYINKLYSQFEGWVMISGVWPTKPFILETTIEGDKATVKVEAVRVDNKPVLGTFQLKQTNNKWMVSGGDWEGNLFIME